MNLTSLSQPAARGAAWARAAVMASIALLALTACGGSDDVDRGPTTIAVTAKLDGLHWDVGTSHLYLTDDDANAIKRWDGDDRFSTVANLPALQAGQRATLGQLTRAADGKLYAARFGFGSYGTVVAVPREGAAYNLAGLDATRRRIGLVPTPEGTLIDSWFKGGQAGASNGTVSELTVGEGGQASERDLITGLNKPVGLAVVGDRLFVSDQGAAQVLVYSLAAVRKQPATAADGQVLAVFTTADGLDLMAASRDGTLYLGGSGGTLYRIGADGAVKALASGWPGIRGLAVDDAAGRLFAAVTAATPGEPSSIRIVPLD